MKTAETGTPFINPFEDQKKAALEHYREISSQACHWNGFVEAAIKAYQPAPAKEGAEEVERKITLKVGNHYVLDRSFNNGGIVELVELFNKYYCVVRDVETGSTWDTMQARLTEIPIWARKYIPAPTAAAKTKEK